MRLSMLPTRAFWGVAVWTGPSIGLPDLNCLKNAANSVAARREKPDSPLVTNLPAGHVIHTVGPVWHGGDHNEDNLLASCYRNSLELALKHKLRSIAFPSISTGVYRFPIERASRIALRVIHDFVVSEDHAPRVMVVCFSEADQAVYQKAYQELMF